VPLFSTISRHNRTVLEHSIPLYRTFDPGWSAKQEVGKLRPHCCSVSDNWRLVGTVRKVEFKLLQLKPAPGLLIASTREDSGATLILITAGNRE